MFVMQVFSMQGRQTGLIEDEKFTAPLFDKISKFPVITFSWSSVPIRTWKSKNYDTARICYEEIQT